MTEALSKKMIIHVSPSLHERLKRAATASGTSMSEYVRTSVSQRIETESAQIAVTLPNPESKDREY